MSYYLRLSDIKILQIETTSLCNLACPQCERIHKGRPLPGLPMNELESEDYNKIFCKEKLPQLKEVFFIGNFGDPIASKNLDYILKILHKKKIKSRIFTNGSLKNKLYWKNLGKLFAQTGSTVVFSIDGLRDTNPIYRVNSQWDKIMDNVKAYIKAGGQARWDFLIFKHNQHQLESAKNLAEKLGFKEFLEKKTARFLNIEKMKKESFKLIFNKTGKAIGKIENISEERKDFEKTVNKWGTFKKYLNKTPIHCKYKNDLKGIYIDFMARVWPCCWLGPALYYNHNVKHPEKKQLDLLIKRYGINFNSLRHYRLSEILEHEWFQSKLVKSWQNKTTDQNFRFISCGRVCGADYEYTSGPKYKNALLTKF